ncbi:MAG: hypothetical protein ACTHMM_13390 [Agriterribacter sp.]
MRRNGEVFINEVQTVRAWAVWSRISRSKHPKNVRVDVYDWHVVVYHTRTKMHKALQRLQEHGNFVWYVVDIDAPEKLKHEPEKEVKND